MVLTADEAMFIANLLARYGMLIDFTLELPEDDSYMFRIEPRECREAHQILLDALEERWLGHSAK